MPTGATVLLQAPPGAGKTTRVPLAVLEALDAADQLLLIQPRRLAARAAAQRLAEALGEPVGERVGYSVRLESRLSPRTRILVVTPGVFLRMLQADPALEVWALVVFDEVHERRADLDLALALLRQARQVLRPELRLLLMSATLDLEPLAAALDGATVLTSMGRSHPVEVHYQPPRPEERLERQVVRALESWWLQGRASGETVLVFLPGQREIRGVQRAIAATPWGERLACVPLHAQLPLAVQSEAIGPARGAEGKVVLATAIAESSLTLAGVRLVIDSGLSRLARFDPSTGMDGLVTVPSSQASAEQRRGRAGRLGPGCCVRLWSPAEQERRPPFTPPEILDTDPLPLALQLAAWGAGQGQDLPWLDAPSPGLLAQAWGLLGQLGAVDGEGHLTDHGRSLLQVGLHPRLGHMLLLAEQKGWLPLAAALAALLSERDPLASQQVGCDLLLRLDWLLAPASAGDGSHRLLHRLQRDLEQQVARAVGRLQPQAPPFDPDGQISARLIGSAYPEWMALSRGQGDGRFLMHNGRGARVHPQDPLASADALAVAALVDASLAAGVPVRALEPFDTVFTLFGAMTEDEVIDMNRRLSGGDASLNATVGSDGDSVTQWQDWLEDTDADQAGDYEARDELEARRELLMSAMEALNDREKDILVQRRLSDQPVTLEDLSESYGVSRERIRQIEVRAFEKLQSRMRELARGKGMLIPA
jgi:ATP-dependent helicase HrpB